MSLPCYPYCILRRPRYPLTWLPDLQASETKARALVAAEGLLRRVFGGIVKKLYSVTDAAVEEHGGRSVLEFVTVKSSLHCHKPAISGVTLSADAAAMTTWAEGLPAGSKQRFLGTCTVVKKRGGETIVWQPPPKRAR